MPRLTKEMHHANLHSEAMADFSRIQSACRDERMQCLADRRFYSIAGAQWEGPIGEQFENKPRLEVNKIHLAIIRIINEYRNNRVTVDFIAKDGDDGSDELAETLDSIYRADEQDSVAAEAYDNAFEEAVGGGFGAWRLRADYVDDDNDEDERQRICIEPIFDADSTVFFDVDARRQDKSDARSCFVLTPMSRSAFEDEYPHDDPASWPKSIHLSEFDWCTPDVVVIAEWYRVEEKRNLIHIFRTADDLEVRHSADDLSADDGALAAFLASTGAQEVRRKKTKAIKVHKYLLSGGAILEDCGLIAGRNIPIVPIFGKRWVIDGVERMMGHVRLAKDAQRLKNMQLSKLAEISALSATEKPIFTPEQMAGHSVMWSEDNLTNYPYLLVNPVLDKDGVQQSGGPLAYTKPPSIPPAMAALLQVTEQDMADILGNQQNGDKIVSNISGKAIEMIQTRLDMQTFIYVSNFAKGMKRCGEIWRDMAREIYVEDGRRMKTLSVDGKAAAITINTPAVDDDGAEYSKNDLSSADFDVQVDVGPSSASKKASTVRSLTALMSITQDPETLNVLMSMALLNMEGEGLGDVRDFFRQRMVKIGAVKPTEDEQAAMQQAAQSMAQQPDAQAEYLAAASEEAKAKAAKARADTVSVVATSEKTRAQTEKIKVDTLVEVGTLDMMTSGLIVG